MGCSNFNLAIVKRIILMKSTCRYRMVSLVEKMLSLHKQFPKAGTPHEKTALESGLIEATDGQIDALVYELYALTEEEIGIVEAKSK